MDTDTPQELSPNTPEEVARDADIAEFLETRKATAEKQEKTEAALEKAREAKATKAAERKAAEAAAKVHEESEVDDEIQEFVAAKKKDPVLKGKPKEEPKPAPAPVAEEAAEEDEMAEPEAKEKDSDEPEEKKDDEPEDAKKRHAEDAKKFAALSRREKLVVDRERAVEEARKKTDEQVAQVQHQARTFVEQERQKLAAKEKEVDQWRSMFEKFRRSPRGLLEAAGFSVKDAVEEIVQDGSPQAVIQRDIERQMAQLRAETQARLDASEKARAAAEQRAQAEREAAAIANFKSEVNEYIAKNPVKYEWILLNGEQDRVWRTIERHHAEHGVIPEISDAADVVEQALDEYSKKIRSAKKFRSSEETSAQTQAASSKPENKPVPQARGTKTLTNTMVSAPRSEVTENLLDMDDDEAMAIVIARNRQKRRAG